MKINVVIDSCSRAAGGLFEAERRLHQSLNGTCVKISVFSLKDQFSAQDFEAWSPLAPGSFPAAWPWALGRSSQLRNRLLAEPADLLYRAGLWTWPSRYSHEWCRKHGKPEIIAPHGMLDPWAVKNSAWKKRLVGMLYEQEHLERATCIRALCEAEAKAIRDFGLKNPICIIPNGIDLPEDGGRRTDGGCLTSDFSRLASGRKTLLYLGRVHPKKGLVNLLRAWSKVQKMEAGSPSSVICRPYSEWQLAIAGWDQGGHEDELKRLCTELQIPFADIREHSTFNIDRPTTNAAAAGGGFSSSIVRPQTSSFSVSDFQRFSVLFLGPQFNDAKAACYASCDAFILPSLSEGLPMVVLEAWAHGKPVLMTPECNLPEGFAANAAIRIETSTESIAQGLQDLFRLPTSDLRLLGASGRGLVTQKFTWPKVATEMKSVYEWMLGGGLKPECIIK